MEAPTRGITTKKFHAGLAKSLETIYQRAIRIAPQPALPYEMFTQGVPYEASRTYRTMKSEFECTKCFAMVEAHRQTLRGF